MTSDLETSLKIYRKALNDFVMLSGKKKNVSRSLLRILLVRENIARTLVQALPDSAMHLRQLSVLDERLRQILDTHTYLYSDIEDIKLIVSPPETSWWWKSLSAKPHRADRFDLLFICLEKFTSFFAIACLAGGIALLLNITSRIFTGGPDLIGAISIILPSALTLFVAKEVLNSSNIEWINNLLKKPTNKLLKRVFRINYVSSHYLQESKLIFSFFRLILSVAFILLAVLAHYNLPKFSFWTHAGKNSYNKKDLADAETNLKRALAVHPDDAEAHFYLALVYEDLQRLDEARNSYGYAVQSGNLDAYNNLARLYILKKDYSLALTLLKQLETFPGKRNQDIKFALYKNRGWAEFKLGSLNLASESLEQAIAVRPLSGEQVNRGAALCLKAQVLYAQEKASYEAKVKDEKQPNQEFQISPNLASSRDQCLTSSLTLPEELEWQAEVGEQVSSKKSISIKKK